jgi:hypothetical protein
MFVNTLAENRGKYTLLVYELVVLAWMMQQMFCRPSTRVILRIIDNNSLPNCPITKMDIMEEEKRFGPDVGSLTGKTFLSSSDVVADASIISPYHSVIIACDIMFINRMPFKLRFIPICTCHPE